jgi:hypothetical protein
VTALREIAAGKVGLEMLKKVPVERGGQCPRPKAPLGGAFFFASHPFVP